MSRCVTTERWSMSRRSTRKRWLGMTTPLLASLVACTAFDGGDADSRSERSSEAVSAGGADSVSDSAGGAAAGSPAAEGAVSPSGSAGLDEGAEDGACACQRDDPTGPWIQVSLDCWYGPSGVGERVAPPTSFRDEVAQLTPADCAAPGPNLRVIEGCGFKTLIATDDAALHGESYHFDAATEAFVGLTSWGDMARAPCESASYEVGEVPGDCPEASTCVICPRSQGLVDQHVPPADCVTGTGYPPGACFSQCGDSTEIRCWAEYLEDVCRADVERDCTGGGDAPRIAWEPDCVCPGTEVEGRPQCEPPAW
jgi:hypothetical protein